MGLTANLFSPKQLQTSISIADAEMDIHFGPYGCGKTFAIALGLGLACMRTKPPDSDACIAILGKTSVAVKSSFGGTLSKLFGVNFRYSSSKKDGYVKDALLFGHKIRFAGLHDADAENRIRGMNVYKIIGEEVSTWSKNNFELVQGRLRGSDKDVPKGWRRGFVGSTNPDSPSHWLAKLLAEVKKGINVGIRFIQWTEFDNILPDAKEYYAKLRNLYRNSPAYLARYVLGQWSAADNLIYTEFNASKHTLSTAIIKQLKEAGAFASYRFGVDYGVTNPTAILVIGKTKDDEDIVLEEKFLRGLTTSQIFPHIRKLYAEYGKNYRGLYHDPSAAALRKELEIGGIPGVMKANNDVDTGIDVIKDLFAQNKLFVAENCKETLDELVTYSYSNPDLRKVKKENDHGMDALRYAIMRNRKKGAA